MLQTLSTVAPHFATLKVVIISHYNFMMEALHSV